MRPIDGDCCRLRKKRQIYWAGMAIYVIFLARLGGEISNPQDSQAGTGVGRSGRPIGSPSEARNSREIEKLARLEGECLNSLFKTLEDWNDTLDKDNIELSEAFTEGVESKPLGPESEAHPPSQKTPSRGGPSL